VGGGFGGATVELVDHGVPFGSVRADHQSVIVTACRSVRSQRIIADHSGTDSQTRYSDESCNELHRRHQGAARDDWGTVSCACFSFFLYFFSLRTADWGKVQRRLWGASTGGSFHEDRIWLFFCPA
jgi:hypothetical protein